MDLSDVLFVIPWPTVGGSFITGVAVGLLLARNMTAIGAQKAAVEFAVPFVLTMLLARWSAGSAQWESWLGVIGLVLVYSGGIFLGRTVTIRRHRRLSENQEYPGRTGSRDPVDYERYKDEPK